MQTFRAMAVAGDAAGGERAGADAHKLSKGRQITFLIGGGSGRRL